MANTSIYSCASTRFTQIIRSLNDWFHIRSLCHPGALAALLAVFGTYSVHADPIGYWKIEGTADNAVTNATTVYNSPALTGSGESVAGGPMPIYSSDVPGEEIYTLDGTV